MLLENTLQFAQACDTADSLRSFRQQFLFPQHHDRNAIYLCGNSLGLQPKTVRDAIGEELDYWQQHGVEGWFAGSRPWLSYHRELSELAAPIVGAKPEEVILMNTLTVNLHLLMVSFYRPTPQRYKIIMESGAFPSDQYAMEMQARFHGYDPKEAIIEISPREGEYTLRTADILDCIAEHGDTVALVMFAGINYYTGQLFDLKKIIDKGHEVGALVGLDLAHAAGNVPLQLHEWQADFAVWCTYKYLNSAPGGISGAFVHEKHGNNPNLNRFAGWWGHDEGQRFKMEKGFIPMQGAAGWQVSTVQVIPSAIHKASLKIFQAAGGMSVLRAKSKQLTAYLEFLLKESNHSFQIITPSNPDERGSQLSLLTDHNGKQLFDNMTQNGIIGDWREPNVIRLAPTALYNSFEDVWQAVKG